MVALIVVTTVGTGGVVDVEDTEVEDTVAGEAREAHAACSVTCLAAAVWVAVHGVAADDPCGRRVALALTQRCKLPWRLACATKRRRPAAMRAKRRRPGELRVGT
jgi:hypothetical protein